MNIIVKQKLKIDIRKKMSFLWSNVFFMIKVSLTIIWER